VFRRRQDDIHRTFVCSECASERARLYSGAGLDLERVVARLERNAVAAGPSYECRMCGTTLADIIADGRPGCCVCYARFAGEVEQAIRAAQGKTSHVGKAPDR